jgi:prophage regulatory protein
MDQPDKIVRLKDLPHYVGLRRTQIEEMIQRGEFPKPIKLGPRAKGWLASEIAQWQHERIADRARSQSGLPGRSVRNPS